MFKSQTLSISFRRCFGLVGAILLVGCALFVPWTTGRVFTDRSTLTPVSVDICSQKIVSRPCIYAGMHLIECTIEINWVDTGPGIGYWDIIGCEGMCGNDSYMCVGGGNIDYCKTAQMSEVATAQNCNTINMNCGVKIGGNSECQLVVNPISHVGTCRCPGFQPVGGNCNEQTFDADNETCTPNGWARNADANQKQMWASMGIANGRQL